MRLNQAFALAREPLGPAAAAGAACAAAGAVALYCVAYNGLAGRSESIVDALAWAAVNVLPWLGAFEAAKRLPARGGSVYAVGGGLAASALLHLIVYGLPAQPLFELARRVPAAFLLMLALLLLRRSSGGAPRPPAELPLLAHQIDWVAAAGNYVEIHAGGRTLLHRAPLTAVEAALAAHGFVRIHRSTLVRRAAIARVRRVDLLLGDGTSLRLGKRYRAAVAGDGDGGDFRPFVPAE